MNARAVIPAQFDPVKNRDERLVNLDPDELAHETLNFSQALALAVHGLADKCKAGQEPMTEEFEALDELAHQVIFRSREAVRRAAAEKEG